jgi:hypothetical protein
MNEPRQIPFQGTNYNYRVILGSVTDSDSISWESRYHCEKWGQVAALAEMWREVEDFPVVEVETVYEGGLIHD